MELTYKTGSPEALIRMYRLQMLVHSCIYYHFDKNIISDYEWSRRALLLRDLQEKYPDISKKVEYYEAFEGWDGSTGFDLPFNDPKIISKARQILKYKKENEHVEI